MKSNVTLKEMVGTKIIYAVLLVCYYWMWARQDWHQYYGVIQNTVFIFTIAFFAIRANRVRKYGKKEQDQRTIQVLQKADAIGLKIMVAAVMFIAAGCAVAFIDGRTAGYALVGTIFALTVIRYVLFCVMGKGETA